MNLLLTGSPGAGKTTVIVSTVGRLHARGVEVSGFYTEEVREDGRRIGFDIVLLGEPAEAVPLPSAWAKARWALTAGRASSPAIGS